MRPSTNVLPVWKTPADASPQVIRDTRARRKTDQAAESARLLYVALTRPRSWLIVAGAGDAKTDRKEGPKPVQDWAWYRLVERAMRAMSRHAAGDLRGAMIALVFILSLGPAAKLPGFTLFKPVSR